MQFARQPDGARSYSTWAAPSSCASGWKFERVISRSPAKRHRAASRFGATRLRSPAQSNVVVRYLRVRVGDFNVRTPNEESKSEADAVANRAKDLDPRSANGLDIGRSNRVIVDHVSVAWGVDETLSVTRSRDVTVQNSIIAESLNESFHPKGSHGYGTLIRGELTPADQEAGIGGYTFYQNLWAHHRARNPSIGGQQKLDDGQAEADRRRTDVNLVNNVIYNWADQPTHRSEMGEVRVNFVGNYFVNGPAKKSDYVFNEDNPAHGDVSSR